MMSYYVEWHMRRDLALLLFAEEDPEARQATRATIVATTRATTVALVKRNKKVSLCYKVKDSVPGSGKASVTLKIFRGAKLKKTIGAGVCATNVRTSYPWRCTLAKGAYTIKVFATDQAGNGQVKVGSARLTVK